MSNSSILKPVIEDQKIFALDKLKSSDVQSSILVQKPRLRRLNLFLNYAKCDLIKFI